jgi:NAD(P)-dependent dehydrogenase (short-subunit alcohol dehydrogenase family)
VQVTKKNADNEFMSRRESKLHILINNAGVRPFPIPSLETRATRPLTEYDIDNVCTLFRDHSRFRNPIRCSYHSQIFLSHPSIAHTKQTNYLSHFLLTHLLLPTLFSTATTAPPGTVRIINVSSSGHAQLAPKDGINLNDLNLKDKSTWTRYGHSKLCQVLHAKSLAEKFGSKGLVAVSLHPGTVKT